jgi:hypothetical protein
MLLLYGSNTIFSNAMASSDEEKYKSYERDDYKKSKNNIVNENNCINNNNFNLNTQENSNGSSSSGGLVATEEGIEKETYPNTYGTNEDKYNNQNDKAFLCIINNYITIGTGESIPTLPTFSPDDCDDCFLSISHGGRLPEIYVNHLDDYLAKNYIIIDNREFDVRNVFELCNLIERIHGISEIDLRAILILAFSDDTEDPVYFAVMDVITDCIQEVGLLIPT